MALFCLGTSALTSAAMAAVIDYPDGSNNAAPIVLTDNTTQLQVITGSATQSGVISQSGGTFGLAKTGSGTLTLTAANTYSGGTTVSAGILRLGPGGSLAGGQDLTIGSNGTFDLNGNSLSIRNLQGDAFSAALALGGGSLTINQTVSSVFAGKVTGTGPLVFNGPANLTIGGMVTNSNYSGNITVNNGALTVDAGISGGNVTINGGTLVVAPRTLGFGTLSGTGGTLTINGSFVTFTSNANSSFGGAITGITGQITKAGNGILTLTGADSFTGDVVVTGGTLAYGNGGTSGGSAFGNITDNGALIFNRSDSYTYTGNIGGTGTLTKLGANTLTINGNVTTTGLLTIGGGTLVLAGLPGADITDNGVLVVQGANGTYGGDISGTGSFVVGPAGAGNVLTLTGTNSYTGGTTVVGGTLRLGTTGRLANTGDLTVNGGTFDLNGHNQAVGALSGTGGSITLGSGMLTTSTGLSTQSASTISGTGSLQVSGVGTLTLTGASTYSGGTVINGGGGGGIVLGSSTAAGTGSIFLTATSLANLGYADGVSVANAVVLGGPFSQLSVSSGATATQAGVISEAGGSRALAKAGFGTLILTGNNTYTGGTTISLGTLQVSADQNLSDPAGAIRLGNNTSLAFGAAFNLKASHAIIITAIQGTVGTINTNAFDITLAQGISGTGAFNKAGTGILTLNAVSTYAGPTGVSQGILRLGVDNALPFNALTVNGTLDLNDHVQTIGALNGSGSITLGTGTLTINGASNPDAIISGAGSVVIANNFIASKDQAWTGGTTVTSTGSLQIGVNNAGSVAGNVTDNGTVIFNRNDTITFSGAISGTGLVRTSIGTTILTGANSYTGGTTISGGTLQIGNGGTSGSLAGDVANGDTLVFNRSDAATFAGVISGTGVVKQTGSGILMLSGLNTYTGATTVGAGTLNVTGAIASSAVTVQSGGTLTGTGRVGATTVASGGAVTPGLGTLSVAGNLTVASGATYADALTPTATGLTSVSGSASLNGNFAAAFASGSYAIGQRYTVITAGSGVSGAFSALTTAGLPLSLRGRLSYDANNVYLNLDPNALAPSLSGGTANQNRVVGAIDAAVMAGGVAGSGFNALYSLSGAALNGAIDQISGQVGANTSSAVGQSFLSFLSLTSQGDSGTDAPLPAQLGSGETRVWGAAYGGHAGISADAASGAAGLSASNVGGIAGVDLQLNDGFLVGATAGFGRQDFRSGNGTGDSDDAMIGIHARKDAGPLHVTAAFGYGWHAITTRRTVTVSGTDVLQGKEDAHDYGGRVEAGWRVAMDSPYALTPYAAIAAESFETPAYAETAVSGASTFALSYAAHTSMLGRTELGAQLARDYDTGDGVLSAQARLAWAHGLDDTPLTQATFLSLAGASFAVTGVRPDRDTALLGLGLEMQNRSGLFVGVKGETQLGNRTTILEGMGRIGYRW